MAIELKAHRGLLAPALIVAIGVLPLVFGFMVMTLQLDRQLEANVRQSVAHTLQAVDQLLDQMQVNRLEALALPGHRGAEALAGLQAELARDLRLQSLTQANSDLTLQVELAGIAIWGHRGDDDRHPAYRGEFLQHAHSSKHGYTVQGSYSPGHTGRQARQSMLQVLPSLALVSIMTGATGYLGLTRSPRRLRTVQGSV